MLDITIPPACTNMLYDAADTVRDRTAFEFLLFHPTCIACAIASISIWISDRDGCTDHSDSSRVALSPSIRSSDWCSLCQRRRAISGKEAPKFGRSWHGRSIPQRLQPSRPEPVIKRLHELALYQSREADMRTMYSGPRYGQQIRLESIETKSSQG